MKLVDMHCDTISEIYEKKKEGRDVSLQKGGCKVTVRGLQDSCTMLQCFAMFVNLKKHREEAYAYANALIDTFDQELKENPGLSLVKSYGDILENQRLGKISAMLTLEEGEVIEGSLEKLKALYDRGARMMTLTWNYENSLAFPNEVKVDSKGCFYMVPDTTRGLTKRGFEAVAYMQELGMVVDVSHLSDRGIFDVLKIAKKPFVASHSNARAMASHPRNLTDEMIRRMAEGGCVAGLNFYPGFLSDHFTGRKKISYVEDCISMVKYMLRVGGSDFPALGSDYDGFEEELEWRDASGTPVLIEAMERAGIPGAQIDKITHENALRVFRETLS